MRWEFPGFWVKDGPADHTSATHQWSQTLHDVRDRRSQELGASELEILRSFPCEYLSADNLERDLLATFRLTGLVSAFEYFLVMTQHKLACVAPEGDPFNDQIASAERALSDTMDSIKKSVHQTAHDTLALSENTLKRIRKWLNEEQAEKLFFAEVLLPKRVQGKVYRLYLESKADPAASQHRKSENLASLAIQEARNDAISLLRRPLWVYALAIFSTFALLGSWAYSKYIS